MRWIFEEDTMNAFQKQTFLRRWTSAVQEEVEQMKKLLFLEPPLFVLWCKSLEQDRKLQKHNNCWSSQKRHDVLIAMHSNANCNKGRFGQLYLHEEGLGCWDVLSVSAASDQCQALNGICARWVSLHLVAEGPEYTSKKGKERSKYIELISEGEQVWRISYPEFSFMNDFFYCCTRMDVKRKQHILKESLINWSVLYS